MKKNNLKNLSDGALEVLEVLKTAKSKITFNELKENGLENLNSAHLTALVSRGLVNAEMKEKEFTKVAKRKVNVYTITEKGLAEPKNDLAETEIEEWEKVKKKVRDNMSKKMEALLE